ncbi:hypothetical protein HZH66_011457 [Vespula vulgaris]|uniref:PiggyBac transposable element-derived protein domain-containing protein n=1 Tax=Vespula vulgaris TaxID=7454 RepID=A0A834MWF8_VESVU|nr:hypothetical protein HZH66_011457 [Vespula vulgaris]
MILSLLLFVVVFSELLFSIGYIFLFSFYIFVISNLLCGMVLFVYIILPQYESEYLQQLHIITKPKFGDQMARKYSVKSKSYRWPVQVSFNILDSTGINAWILYKETSRQNISRQQFLLQIAEELIEEYHEFLQEEKEDLQGTLSGQGNISHSQKTCQIRLCKENKTTKACIICEKYVYGKCIKKYSFAKMALNKLNPSFIYF